MATYNINKKEIQNILSREKVGRNPIFLLLDDSLAPCLHLASSGF
jgi:hypothetical protein